MLMNGYKLLEKRIQRLDYFTIKLLPFLLRSPVIFNGRKAQLITSLTGCLFRITLIFFLAYFHLSYPLIPFSPHSLSNHHCKSCRDLRHP